MEELQDQSLYFYAKQLQAKGNSWEELTKALTQKSDDATVEKVISELKKEIHEKRFQSGMIKLGIGGSLLLLGFIVSCINFHLGQSFQFILYFATSVGISLFVWALWDIFN